MALDNYVHPHLSSTIIDNSEVTSVVSATAETGTILFMPIVSERGKTGVTQLFTDPLAFVKEYGEPNFKKYGQTMYNALRWLLNGGQVRALRVLPDSATASSVSFKVSLIDVIEINEGTDEYGNPIIVDYEVITKDDENETKVYITVDEETGEEVENIVPASADLKRKYKTVVDGANTDALFTIRCKGKGKYGKGYSISFSDNNSFGETYDFPLYNLTINKETTLGTKPVEGPYLVALKPDAATKAGNPLFIKNVLEAYSPDFEVEFFEDTYYKMIEEIDGILSTLLASKKAALATAKSVLETAQAEYNTADTDVTTAQAEYDAAAQAVSEATEVSEVEQGEEGYDEWVAYKALLDAKTAKQTALTTAQSTKETKATALRTAQAAVTTAQNEVNQCTGSAEKVDFIFGVDATYGIEIYGKSELFTNVIPLEGGTDGAGLDDVILYKDKAVTFESLLKRAFCIGNAIDDSILNKRNYPIDVILDANFPLDVKIAAQSFKDMRGDCFAYLSVPADTNSNSYSAVKNWVDNYVGGDSSATLNRDYSSALYSQSFVCTDTYCGADITVDFSYILAAMIPAHDKKYGVILPMAGARRGIISGFKKMSFNPNDEQQDSLYRAKVNYAIQTTANTRINSNITLQDKNSALSNINNVRQCFLIMRAVEDISDKYEFEFADGEVLRTFQSELDSTLAQFAVSLDSISGTVYQNEYDKEQKIVRVRIELVFKDIIERIIIEMNVGR